MVYKKNVDDTRLKFAKGLVNDSIAMGNNAKTSNLPSKYTPIIKRTAADKPSWMKQNSIKVSNGIKFFGKLALMQASDKNLALSGKLSLIAKVVTLTGKDEDLYKLEKDQSFLTRMRRKSNAISGILEWVANISLFAGSIFKVPADAKSSKFTLYNFDDAVPRWKNNTIQWFQMLGALTIFGSLTAKSLAPFTKKKLDVEELCTHSTIALVESIKQGNHTEELTRLTARMLQTRELPELKTQGFANVFTDIANRLEQHHGIAISAPKVEEKDERAPAEEIALAPQAAEKVVPAQATPSELEQPHAATANDKTQAEKRPNIASELANAERASSLTERVSSEAKEQSVSSAGV